MKNKKITTEEFITKAKTIHGNKYDYSEVEYINSKSLLTIKCSKHGIFKQKAYVHYNLKRGCPICGGSKKYSTEEFITKAKLIHDNKYDYSKVTYINNKTKIKIICPIHGIFEQLPSSHLKGHGCKKCSMKEAGAKRKGDINKYIELCEKIHNNYYSYTNTDFKNIHTPIEMICPKHGKFNQSIANHLYNETGCPKCRRNYSTQEQFINDFLTYNNINFIERDKKILNGLELDFYLPDYNIAIECNGLYWHGELNGGKDRQYHLNKSILCKNKSIQLLHIFEDEILYSRKVVISKLKSILNINKRKVYGRKCIVKEINSKLKSKFLNKYHLQGDCKSKYNLGLYYNNRLISVMTFSNRRLGIGKFKKDENEYELSRFCNNYNFYVIGGASKLLKYFERNYTLSKIITYADKRWSQGDVYFKLGFNHSHDSKPNYWYYDKHLRKRFYRFNFRKSLLKNKLEVFDETITEWKNMQNNGWDRIWDCGNMVFEKCY